MVRYGCEGGISLRFHCLIKDAISYKGRYSSVLVLDLATDILDSSLATCSSTED